MRKVAIVGAGQSGLQLGLGLLKNGYQVTLYSDRSADEIQNGYITSNQAMFSPALAHEAQLDLNQWEDQAPQNNTVYFSLLDVNTKMPQIHWRGKTKRFFQSVDQRIKFSSWIKLFETLGGKLVIDKISPQELETTTKAHDLTIIATGKGQLGKLFQIDNDKTRFNSPQRALSVTYLRDVAPKAEPGVSVNLLPGIGEMFIMPGLGLAGVAEMVLFEGIIGGPLDCWDSSMNSDQHLLKTLSLMEKYFPTEFIRCQNACLSDKKAILSGKYTPVVRQPIGYLPDQSLVLGMADAVVLNDPIAGQGSNNASHCANFYLKAILQRGKNEFDDDWVMTVFDKYWDYAKWSTELSNTLLKPPSQELIDLLRQAENNQIVADQIAQAFESPKSFFEYLENISAEIYD